MAGVHPLGRCFLVGRFSKSRPIFHDTATRLGDAPVVARVGRARAEWRPVRAARRSHRALFATLPRAEESALLAPAASTVTRCSVSTRSCLSAVSYTHLTLPTICSV